MNSIIPNSTQVPNIVLDELMPKLKNVELRVLLVIIRQTLGWIEDLKTGRRKQDDWISIGQLMMKTGSSDTSVSKAITELCNLGIIEARSESGEILETPQKRTMVGGRIYYRISTNAVNKSLFSGHKGVDNKLISRARKGYPAKNLGGKKFGTTKETVITKLNNNKYIKISDRQKNKERLRDMKQKIMNR